MSYRLQQLTKFVRQNFSRISLLKLGFLALLVAVALVGKPSSASAATMNVQLWDYNTNSYTSSNYVYLHPGYTPWAAWSAPNSYMVFMWGGASPGAQSVGTSGAMYLPAMNSNPTAYTFQAYGNDGTIATTTVYFYYYAPTLSAQIWSPSSGYSSSYVYVHTNEQPWMSWSATEATSLSINGVGGYSTAGSGYFSPNQTSYTQFTITASGPGGSTSRTFYSYYYAPSGSISVNPTTIVSGDSTILSWSTADASSASISNVGSVGLNGSGRVSPTVSTQYCLNVTGPGSNGSSQSVGCQTVTLQHPPAASVSGPTTVAQGGTASYSVNASDIDGNLRSVSLWVKAPSSSTWQQISTATCSGSSCAQTLTWSTGSNPAGAYSVAVEAVDTNSLTCSGKPGSSISCGSSAILTTAVSTPPTLSLTATATNLDTGQSTTLNWNSANATSVSIDNGIGTVTPAAGGSRVVTPARSTTYIATATGATGLTTTSSVRININGPVITLIADPTSIYAIQSSNLVWTAKNVASLSIDQGVGAIPAAQWAAGSQEVKPQTTTVYTLTGTSPDGQTVTRTAKVTVSAVPTASLNVNGDIQSSNNITGVNILDPKALISARGTISVNGAAQAIPHYTVSNQLAWTTIRTKLLVAMDSLKISQGKTWTSLQTYPINLPASIGGSTVFNLNPLGGNPLAAQVDTFKPEGGVWRVDGDLDITAPMTFTNTGTIIVTGSVHIIGAGSITDSSGTLGIMAKGTGGIRIEKDVQSITGVALFASDGPISIY